MRPRGKPDLYSVGPRYASALKHQRGAPTHKPACNNELACTRVVSREDLTTRSVLLLSPFPDLRRDLSRAASPHPGLSICLFGPREEMPGKLFLWYVPLRAVLEFA